MIRDYLAEIDEEILLLTPEFDEAIIGYVERISEPTTALYDIDKIVKVLMEKDGMSCDEAIEYMNFNIIGAYVGPYTPHFTQLFHNLDGDL